MLAPVKATGNEFDREFVKLKTIESREHMDESVSDHYKINEPNFCTKCLFAVAKEHFCIIHQQCKLGRDCYCECPVKNRGKTEHYDSPVICYKGTSMLYVF
jgi:hypothetical protein